MIPTGPKEKLRRAADPSTPVSELVSLAESEYAFVRAEVAANPRTPQETLSELIPKHVPDETDFSVVLKLLANQNLTPEIAHRIAKFVELNLEYVTPRSFYPLQVIDALFESVTVPIDDLKAILQAAPNHLVRRIAGKSSTRADALQVLADHASETVRKKVKSRIGG